MDYRFQYKMGFRNKSLFFYRNLLLFFFFNCLAKDPKLVLVNIYRRTSYQNKPAKYTDPIALVEEAKRRI